MKSLTMPSFSRVTTQYLAAEDRLRLAGETGSGTLVLWLTRRLADRLVASLMSRLTQRLADAPQRDAVWSFLQHAARSSLKPSRPVDAGLFANQWLIESVDMHWGPDRVDIVFKGAERLAHWRLGIVALRQWLEIVRKNYAQAGWSLSGWPDGEGGHSSDERASPARSVH